MRNGGWQRILCDRPCGDQNGPANWCFIPAQASAVSETDASPVGLQRATADRRLIVLKRAVGHGDLTPSDEKSSATISLAPAHLRLIHVEAAARHEDGTLPIEIGKNGAVQTYLSTMHAQRAIGRRGWHGRRRWRWWRGGWK